MRIISLCFILCLTISSTLQANTLDASAYGKLPSKSMLVISPSGDRLAYRDVTDGKDAALVINLVDNSIVAAIDISTVKPSYMYFIDDDRLIFVASDHRRIEGYKGEHNVSAAMAYNIKKKKLHQMLVPGAGIFKGQTAVGRIVGVSDDHKYAYMPAYENPGQYNLYRVRLDRKTTPRIAQKGSSDTIDFFVGKDGEVLARERFDNRQNLHRVEAKIDGDWKEIFREETEIARRSFNGLTPDRTKLVMLSQDDNNGRVAYYTMALADGAIEGPIFSNENKDVESVLTDINRVVYGVRYSGFTPSYEFFEKKLNARMNGLKKALPDNNFIIVDHTPDWSQIVFYMDGNQSSGDYILYKDGGLSFLTPSRPDIPREAVNDVVEYTYTARDGLEIPTLLTIPLGKELKNLPAIMMPHGGPESYDKKAFNYRAQYFASQGYLVIQPQFRGSDGFGIAHLMAGRGEWGRKMQDDLTDAVNSLADSGQINKERVCIVGGSYGGYAALSGAAFTPDVYKCVVSINGVSDIPRMLESEERDHGDDHWVVAYWNKVIANGGLDEDHLAQISPINSVSNISAPVLLIHGEDDKVVPIKQSEEMYDEMKDAKKDVTFIELNNGDHYLSTAENRMEAMLAIEAFVKKHI
jgi:dipeptidyl aminopeptidase/acylaminoacyl peptidase